MQHAACCPPNERIELDVRLNYLGSLDEVTSKGFGRSHDGDGLGVKRSLPNVMKPMA